MSNNRKKYRNHNIIQNTMCIFVVVFINGISNMDYALTYVSILATVIAITVALNVAYNFFSIHDFRKKLETLEESVNKDMYDLKENIDKRIKIVEDNTNDKLSTLQVEIEKFREMNKVYAQLLYEVNNANAKFRFNDGCYFEAILEELKNIYHVTTHKDSFSKEKFDEIIGAKYWFIANDIQKYNSDKYVCSDKNDERNKLIAIRDEIILVCKKIESHKNSINVTDKLTPIFFVVRNLIDDLYYHHQVNLNSIYWEKVCKLAK